MLPAVSAPANPGPALHMAAAPAKPGHKLHAAWVPDRLEQMPHILDPACWEEGQSMGQIWATGLAPYYSSGPWTRLAHEGKGVSPLSL